MMKKILMFLFVFLSLSAFAPTVAMAGDGGEGERLNLYHSSGNAVSAEEFNEKPSQACLPSEYYEPNQDECTFCSMFKVVFNTVSSVCNTSITKFSSAVIRVVLVGFGIWLAIQILAFVSSMETRDLKDLAQSLITQGFLVMIAVFILSTGAAKFLNTFIVPIYRTGQLMSQTMFNDCLTSSDETADIKSSGKITTCSADDKNAKFSLSTDGLKAYANGLPVEMGATIVQTMTMMENRVSKFQALGAALLCQSWVDSMIFIVPKFGYFWTGLVLWILASVLIVAVPFLLIDAVFELGVAVAILPVAVGGFPFKATRQYCKKVWETFLNSTFMFLFVSIIVLIVLGALYSAVTDGEGTLENFDELFSSSAGGILVWENILSKLGWFGWPFVRLVSVFLLAWSVMSTGKDFAGKFASSISSTSIGSSIATMAASTTKGMAISTAKPFAQHAWHKIRAGVPATASKVSGAVKDTLNSWRQEKLQSKFDNVKSQDGKKTFTDKNGHTFTLENGVVTETYTKGNRTVTKINSGHMTRVITAEKKKDGKVVYNEKIKQHDNLLNEIMKKDGKIDVNKLQELTKGLEGKAKEEAMIAFTKAAVEKRISKHAHDYGKANNSRPPEVVKMDLERGEMVIRECNDKGEVSFSRVKLHSNGYMEVSMTKVDKNGKVRELQSDGIRNKMSTYKLQEGVKAEDLGSIESVRAAADGSSAPKTRYSYSKHFQRLVDEGFNENAIDSGIMSAEEVRDAYNYINSRGNEMGKASMGFNFNV
jgi:hypothetical protein